jgi:hypothetical protein
VRGPMALSHCPRGVDGRPRNRADRDGSRSFRHPGARRLRGHARRREAPIHVRCKVRMYLVRDLRPSVRHSLGEREEIDCAPATSRNGGDERLAGFTHWTSTKSHEPCPGRSGAACRRYVREERVQYFSRRASPQLTSALFVAACCLLSGCGLIMRQATIARMAVNSHFSPRRSR